MAQKEIHYEIFRRHGAKGAWVLDDVSTLRDKALALAEELMASERATGVKVVKETYDSQTGDFLSLKIFEDGHTRMKVAQAAEDIPHALPCFKPDDLYSYHARATLHRLLRDYLARQKLTVIELIHRADCLEALEANGNVYQHAVQKVAVAQAASTGTPVQQIIKSLNDLATRAIHRVYRDARRNYFPTAKDGAFGALAESLASETDALYRFEGALARHLADCRSWNDKLVALRGVMHDAPQKGLARTLLFDAVDALVAEVLTGSAALHEIIGHSDNLGQALSVLSQVAVGLVPAGLESREGLAALVERFSTDDLPNARTAIVNRIVAELRSNRRLCPDSPLDELTALRRIANSLALVDPRYLSRENLLAAFTIRSRRLVTPDAINEYLSHHAAADAKAEQLLQVEENLIGGENKRLLAAALQQLLASPLFQTRFLSGSEPPLKRLKRLAELQARVRRSGFQEAQRRDFADCLDRLADEIERRSKFFKTLLDGMPNPVERALTVLKLCMSGVLTEGRVAARARELAVAAMGQPGFLAAYLARSERGSELTDVEAAVMEIMQMLQKAGIPHEAGRKLIAA